MQVKVIPPPPPPQPEPKVEITMSWADSEDLRRELYEFRNRNNYPKLIELLDKLRVAHNII